jgi:predicted RNase H-like nuclease (RuvC/YqgF family)
MGKTETIKERAIYVYLPSHDMVKRWKELAKKQGTSISKFVIEHVESSLRQQDYESGFIPRAELMKRLRELEEENASLKKENRMLKLALEKLDDELRSYRAKPFLIEDYQGMRGLEKKLVEVLKRRRFVRGEELLELLSVNPLDIELTKGVYQQLKVLEAYGLVKTLPDGWRWLG